MTPCRPAPLMSFTESLPPDKRHLAWIPVQTVTLTLPDPQGIWTAFQVRRAIQTSEICWNVALYRPAPEEA